MATSPPPTLEDTKEPPPEQPPTQSLGPTLDSLTTDEISQDCKDITLALSNLVSTNARYRRKSYYNCGQCQAVLRNTTSCHCGNSIDFPANLFKKCWTKSLAFFTKLEITSNPTTTTTPKTQVSLHRWARYILSAHGVMFTGLLTNATKQPACVSRPKSLTNPH